MVKTDVNRPIVASKVLVNNSVIGCAKAACDGDGDGRSRQRDDGGWLDGADNGPNTANVDRADEGGEGVGYSCDANAGDVFDRGRNVLGW